LGHSSGAASGSVCFSSAHLGHQLIPFTTVGQYPSCSPTLAHDPPYSQYIPLSLRCSRSCASTRARISVCPLRFTHWGWIASTVTSRLPFRVGEALVVSLIRKLSAPDTGARRRHSPPT